MSNYYVKKEALPSPYNTMWPDTNINLEHLIHVLSNPDQVYGSSFINISDEFIESFTDTNNTDNVGINNKCQAKTNENFVHIPYFQHNTYYSGNTPTPNYLALNGFHHILHFRQLYPTDIDIETIKIDKSNTFFGQFKSEIAEKKDILTSSSSYLRLKFPGFNNRQIVIGQLGRLSSDKFLHCTPDFKNTQNSDLCFINNEFYDISIHIYHRMYKLNNHKRIQTYYKIYKYLPTGEEEAYESPYNKEYSCKNAHFSGYFLIQSGGGAGSNGRVNSRDGVGGTSGAAGLFKIDFRDATEENPLIIILGHKGLVFDKNNVEIEEIENSNSKGAHDSLIINGSIKNNTHLKPIINTIRIRGGYSFVEKIYSIEGHDMQKMAYKIDGKNIRPITEPELIIEVTDNNLNKLEDYDTEKKNTLIIAKCDRCQKSQLDIGNTVTPIENKGLTFKLDSGDRVLDLWPYLGNNPYSWPKNGLYKWKNTQNKAPNTLGGLSMFSGGNALTVKDKNSYKNDTNWTTTEIPFLYKNISIGSGGGGGGHEKDLINQKAYVGSPGGASLCLFIGDNES